MKIMLWIETSVKMVVMIMETSLTIVVMMVEYGDDDDNSYIIEDSGVGDNDGEVISRVSEPEPP